MGAILGLEHHGLVHRSGDHAFESGDHVGLGQPSDIAELAVGGGILVDGEFSCESREVSSLAKDLYKAVCGCAGLGALKQDVLNIGGVCNGLGVHYTNCIESVSVCDNRRNSALAAKYEVVDFLVDAGKLAGLVPVVVKLAVGILEKEGFHILCICKLGISFSKLVVCGSNILGRRNNLEHDILDVAAGGLLKEILMLLVELLDLGRGHFDGAVGHEGVGNIDIVHVCSGVVLGHVQTFLKSILVGAGVEERAILGIILLSIEGALEIVPVKLETAAFVGRDLGDEVADAVRGEIAVLVHEGGVVGNNGGRVCTGGQIGKFRLADSDARGLGILDEQILVHKFLPCGVADLLLGLLVLYAGAGDYFVDLGISLHILKVIGIGNRLAVDDTYVILARH